MRIDPIKNELIFDEQVVPVAVPSTLTVCTDPNGMLNFLKEKYKISQFAFELLALSNMTIEQAALCCQCYYNTKVFPFEILLKIFSYAVDDNFPKNQFLFLDQKSGEEISNFYIDFPGICTVKPRRDCFIINLLPSDLKGFTTEQLAQINKWFMNKLITYNFFKMNDILMGANSKLQVTSNPSVYVKSIQSQSKQLSPASFMPIFPLLDNTYDRDTLEKNPVIRKLFSGLYTIQETMLQNNDHRITILKDDCFLKTIRLVTLNPEKSNYEETAMFANARYDLVTLYKESVIILYDRKTGRYPCILFQNVEGDDILVKNTPFFAHSNPIITKETQDYRAMLLDINNLVEVVQPQAVEPQLEQPPVT